MKIIKFITSTVVLLTALVMARGIHSEATTYGGELDERSYAESEASMVLTEINDPGEAVDPGTGDPIEVKPINPSVSNFKIVYASNWNFGDNEISGKNRTYFAKLDKKIEHNSESEVKVPIVPMISIIDVRGTDRNGWGLTVKQDGPFTDSSKHELIGAELIVTNAFTKIDKNAPAINNATTNLVLSSIPQTIAIAGPLTGSGNWGIGFGEIQTIEDADEATTNGIKLNVPGSSVKNKTKYSTTITYELMSDPTLYST